MNNMSSVPSSLCSGKAKHILEVLGSNLSRCTDYTSKFLQLSFMSTSYSHSVLYIHKTSETGQ